VSGSNQEDAALLTPEQRWEVLLEYRRCRRGHGGLPHGFSPPEALKLVHRIFATGCVHAVLDGRSDEALLRARQCSYELLLLQRWLMGHPDE
jgi:hypothetical protein